MFFFLDTPTPEIYTLSLHDALPISATPTPADSPSAPSAPIPPARGGWWGPALRDRPRGLWAGIILIALGAYLLIDNLGLLRSIRWDIVGPVVLIAAGLLVLARRR